MKKRTISRNRYEQLLEYVESQRLHSGLNYSEEISKSQRENLVHGIMRILQVKVDDSKEMENCENER